MKWVVVFRGARDGYQVPIALKDAGTLSRLVTDWYSPLDRSWLRVASKLLPAKYRLRLGARYRDALPSDDVDVSLADLVYGLATLRDLEAHDRRVGLRAATLAKQTGAGIFAYGFHAHAAFTAPGVENLPKVLYQVEAHPTWAEKTFREEMTQGHQGGSGLDAKTRAEYVRRKGDRLTEAANLADLCIVPSSYVKSTMVEQGVAESRIRVIPYGVDLEQFYPPEQPPRGRFRVLFVGEMTRMKGLAYLLEAWKRLAFPDAELSLVGRGAADHELLGRYQGLYTHIGRVDSRAAMRELYQSHHVCCHPSLSESMPFVLLESMGCGTPLILTRNSAALDVIEDGQEGFVVDIRSVEMLMEKLAWCYEHRDALEAMRSKAHLAALRYTWPAYRQAIVEAVSELDVPAFR